MNNLNLKRVPIATQNLKERLNNFDEVILGYDEKSAILEASRCLNCKNAPCIKGCPINIDIPKFISFIKNKDYENAYKTLMLKTNFPSICGRVCQHEKQCECNCVMGIKGEPISIGNLERFIGDMHIKTYKNLAKPKPNSKKVAIIGSGPSGMSCASDLAKDGFNVTIFESLPYFGGVLYYGIPEFRLPKRIISEEINKLKLLNVNLVCNKKLGVDFSVDSLKKEYDAIYISTGADEQKYLGIAENFIKNVITAKEFLTSINVNNKAFNAKNIVVIGGGNVAMDVARTALRLNANSTIIYRRTKNEMPANKEELNDAILEGVNFKELVNPIRILSKNGIVYGLECLKMTLGEPDASNRRSPIPIINSEFKIDCDLFVLAIGSKIEENVFINENIKLNKDKILVDNNYKTSIDGVFAGGDAIRGPSTVVLAMRDGINAAKSIKKYILEK